MVFASKVDIQGALLNTILVIVLIAILTALLPGAVTDLVTLAETIFNGTQFEAVFAGGLVVYGVMAVALIVLIFSLVGMKGKRK